MLIDRIYLSTEWLRLLNTASNFYVICIFQVTFVFNSTYLMLYSFTHIYCVLFLNLQHYLTNIILQTYILSKFILCISKRDKNILLTVFYIFFFKVLLHLTNLGELPSALQRKLCFPNYF